MNLQYALLNKYNESMCKSILTSEYYNNIKDIKIKDFYNNKENNILSNKIYILINQYINMNNIYNSDMYIKDIIIDILKSCFNYKRS